MKYTDKAAFDKATVATKFIGAMYNADNQSRR